ncbi:bifunctional adenosylcobinamide kinase/adenosylcobinamide-phosphate guanylyltransferase [Sulfurimonas sp. MAG313]|nr:bifunctional adenosylcobinamide kinase/adenosylcobinamide-phosphate guanylyltransferase [Sulfurimonas sp. MAG313]MDF1881642.1 bifunctional adenosylcobinamide kinase/adenosylcobinamide-phosphate guanylyltransferase [Sulfurimonas sp. MAG313]
MGTKTLFIGGIKSGKSYHAEQYTLKHSKNLPVYLATTEFIDKEMKERIEQHKLQRSQNFLTREEPLNLLEAIAPIKSYVLIECISMWINNMLHHGFTFEDIQEHLLKLLELPHDIVFVLNDVGAGIIPDNALARKYIDISGKISQILGQHCDNVFHVIAGIGTKIK